MEGLIYGIPIILVFLYFIYLYDSRTKYKSQKFKFYALYPLFGIHIIVVMVFIIFDIETSLNFLTECDMACFPFLWLGGLELYRIRVEIVYQEFNKSTKNIFRFIRYFKAFLILFSILGIYLIAKNLYILFS
ncbi:MAG: hypothetical protein Kapaf2KO_14840 [Candidatus Kapaibacteriales bacterium]